MNFEEWVAKPLLAAHGILVPEGRLAIDPAQARVAALELGPCIVKAQAPTGGRGKAGGIKLAATPEEAELHAEAILGMKIGGFPIQRLLIETQSLPKRELYTAMVNDPTTRGPMLLFSRLGGMEIEEAMAQDPQAMQYLPIDIAKGLEQDQALTFIQQVGSVDSEILDQASEIAETLVFLYQAYRALDAELLEINPLVITQSKTVMALDCKFTLDDSAASRQITLSEQASPELLTALEQEAAEAGLKYIELGGSVGVLANGAGLTMTSMDAITHYGGSPANFLEIGGEAYTKAETALTILLKNPRIRSLLVNFCGAFARTDVMADGVVAAWKALAPEIPIFFTIHGTGEEEAIGRVQRELGITPYDIMDEAVQAAVAAAHKWGDR